MSLFPIFLLIFTYSVIWPVSLQTVINNSKRYLTQKKALPDLFQIWLNPFKQIYTIPPIVSDIISYSSIMSPIIYGWYSDSLWLDSYLLYMSYLFILRCFLFNVTILPDSSQVAHKKSFFDSYFSGGIHDLMFSGHIANLYAPILFQYRLQNISYLFYLFGCVLTFLSAINMLILRLHYTIDIVVAIACSHWVLEFIM